MLLVNYLHLPRGFPLTQVCGLPLCVRAANSGWCAGFQDIILLVHDQDIEGVRTVLHEHGVTGRVGVMVDKDLPGDNISKTDDFISLVDGGHVWREDVMRTLRTAEISKKKSVFGSFARVAAAEDLGILCSIPELGQNNFLLPGKYSAAVCVHAIASESLMRVRGGNTRQAENFLLEGLVKKQDGIISRTINRRISIKLTAHLMNTQVTPNIITSFVFLIGMASGPLMFYRQGYWGLVAGSCCYYLAAILDGCDGELARLKYLGTPVGAWLDTVVDDLVGLSYLLGLYGSLYLSGFLPLWPGIMAVTAYLLTLGPRYFVMARYLKSGDYQKLSAGKQQSGQSLIAPLIDFLERTVFRTDFIPFAALVCALLNLSSFFAWCVAFGTVFSAMDSAATCINFLKSAETQKNR